MGKKGKGKGDEGAVASAGVAEAALGVVKGKPRAAGKSPVGGGGSVGGAGRAGGGGGGAGDFDLNALFSKGKATKKVKDAAVAAEAAAEAVAAEKEGGNERGREREKDRVLLPGQKKPKQKRENPEFVPVAAPRRMEEGLPVFKSYGDFSDMACGQVAPKDAPVGKCPFECWCCF
jgi:hypothetical protein